MDCIRLDFSDFKPMEIYTFDVKFQLPKIKRAFKLLCEVCVWVCYRGSTQTFRDIAHS